MEAFDKFSLAYLASWHLIVLFLVHPVNRIALKLSIPTQRASYTSDYLLKCGHDECMKYMNKEKYFCRCHAGWSGTRCHLSIDCQDCYADSICVGLLKNCSICVCPFNRFGSRCLLERFCPADYCENNGQCVQVDERLKDAIFVCVCTEHFFGHRCDVRRKKLEISFDGIDTASYF